MSTSGAFARRALTSGWISTALACGSRSSCKAGGVGAAEKLAGLDIEIVIAGFAGHTEVFDAAVVAPYTMLDGQEVPGRVLDQGAVAEVGGYVLQARRTPGWDTVVESLEALAAAQPQVLSSTDARLHGVVERAARGGRLRQSAARRRAGLVRSRVRSRSTPGEARLPRAGTGARLSADGARPSARRRPASGQPDRARVLPRHGCDGRTCRRPEQEGYGRFTGIRH